METTKKTVKQVNLSETTLQNYILQIAKLLRCQATPPEYIVEALDELMDWFVYDAVIDYKDDVRDIELRLRCYGRMGVGYSLSYAKVLYEYIKEQTALLADA